MGTCFRMIERREEHDGPRSEEGEDDEVEVVYSGVQHRPYAVHPAVGNIDQEYDDGGKAPTGCRSTTATSCTVLKHHQPKAQPPTDLTI